MLSASDDHVSTLNISWGTTCTLFVTLDKRLKMFFFLEGEEAGEVMRISVSTLKFVLFWF